MSVPESDAGHAPASRNAQVGAERIFSAPQNTPRCALRLSGLARSHPDLGRNLARSLEKRLQSPVLIATHVRKTDVGFSLITFYYSICERCIECRHGVSGIFRAAADPRGFIQFAIQTRQAVAGNW